jgi:hypothetical protein
VTADVPSDPRVGPSGTFGKDWLPGSLSSRMVAAGSRVTVAAGQLPQGASSSFDEATSLVGLLSFSPYSPWSSAYGQ